MVSLLIQKKTAGGAGIAAVSLGLGQERAKITAGILADLGRVCRSKRISRNTLGRVIENFIDFRLPDYCGDFRFPGVPVARTA
jgi:hypothetical protein